MEKTDHIDKYIDDSVSGGQTNVPLRKEFFGTKLDSNTARQAVVFSEIIGKPLSKRGHRK